MTTFYFDKTAGEDKDFTLDWSVDLGTDTIASSTWSVPAGSVTIASPAPSFTTSTTTVWTAGGDPGDNCLLVNSITTAAGRDFEQRLVISIDPPGY
jgi:hypothetical protein